MQGSTKCSSKCVSNSSEDPADSYPMFYSDLPDYTTPEDCSCNIQRRDNLESRIPILDRKKT